MNWLSCRYPVSRRYMWFKVVEKSKLNIANIYEFEKVKKKDFFTTEDISKAIKTIEHQE